MATSVFGTPITHVTLPASHVEEYKMKQLTAEDRAIIAFETKNDGKDAKAREFVEERRKSYAFDCTMVLIYNATGDAMKLETYCDAGDGFMSPSPHPMIIGNGQWGAYLRRGGGAVVYSVKNVFGREYQVAFIFWANEPGRCHTEIRQKDFYRPKDPWANYSSALNANLSYVHQVHEYGLSSFASIGGTTKSPVFEGIVCLENAWSRYSNGSSRYPYGSYTYSKSALVTDGAQEEGNPDQEDEPTASMATSS